MHTLNYLAHTSVYTIDQFNYQCMVSCTAIGQGHGWFS